MPTPERRTSLSRRGHEQHNHNHQQEPHSPFRRARRDVHDFDASLIPSPTRPSSARNHRRNFSQTGTLRGAFEVASRLPVTTEDDDDNPLRTTTTAISTSARYRSALGGTPNRRKRQGSMYSAVSPDSNPPDELVEAYRQIDDEGSLVDFEAFDDENRDYEARIGDTRSRRLSSGSSIRGNGLFMPSDASFTSESPRRRLVDYTQDEQRLQRATSSRSPIFNKTGTSAALTSENLQRRDEEDQSVEDEGEREGFTGMNLPSTWGSRSKYRQDWLKSFTRNHGIGLESTADQPEERQPARQPLAEIDLKAVSAPERPKTTGRHTFENRAATRRDQASLSDNLNKISFDYQDAKLIDGNQIPNTPIVVYKNSTFTKRSPTKRDSQDLLRKLARTEIPPQNQNQNQFKTPEQPTRGRRIYDKTPLVTGAWIDTPATERVTGFPEHLANDIIRSSPSKIQLDKSPKPSAGDWKPNAGDWKPKWMREAFKPSEEKLEEQPEEGETGDGPKDKLQMEGGPAETKEEKREPKKGVEQKAKPRNKPVLVKPDLPKSALETVLQDHKDNKDPLDVGDDTIESLQIIMDGQPTGLKSEEEEDVAFEKAILEKFELSNTGAPDVVDLNRLNGKLKSLSDNITKVKVGLNSLEDQVSRDNDVLSSISRSPHTLTSPVYSHPNSPYNDGRVYAAIPLPRLWQRDPATGSVRPTRLGWCILVFLTWFFSESTMCDYYCHPFVATVCEGNCLLPNAPRFPFVIPTMLWRWLHLSAIVTPIWAIVLAFVRLTAQLLGLWDGYVDEPPAVVNLTGEIWIRGTRVGPIPTVAATPSLQMPWQWKTEDPKFTQEVVPTLNVRTNTAGESWRDDVSMDDDEIL